MFVEKISFEMLNLNAIAFCPNVIVLIAKDNPWRSLIDSIDNFSDDFMTTKDQPLIDTTESL
ncbi:MAG: hypothetical protein V7K18_11625 [Nostoc sp.]|uniref:hypothetical protein n=1 Tax=Nostoc sp. TaxID=1180 RepID=UPI002FFD4640